MASPPSRASDRYHHGDLRRVLVEVSLDCIDELGPEGLTLREVARRAGVSRAAPYRHFPDKESLFGAVAVEGFEALADAVDRARGPDAGARLRAAGHAYVRFATERPAHFRVMFGTTLPASAVPAGGRAFAALVRRVEAAQAEGFVREGDPAEQARIAWCAVHGAAHLAVQEKLGLDGRRLRTFVGRLLDSLLSGLEPRDGAGA